MDDLFQQIKDDCKKALLYIASRRKRTNTLIAKHAKALETLTGSDPKTKATIRRLNSHLIEHQKNLLKYTDDIQYAHMMTALIESNPIAIDYLSMVKGMDVFKILSQAAADGYVSPWRVISLDATANGIDHCWYNFSWYSNQSGKIVYLFATKDQAMLFKLTYC